MTNAVSNPFRTRVLSLLAALVLSIAGLAAGPPADGGAAFDLLKGLQGTWQTAGTEAFSRVK